MICVIPKHHALYLRIVLMKQPGPSATILNASKQHFTEKIPIFHILPLERKYRVI